MSELIGTNITPDSGTTLRKMIKNNLEPFMVEFESISGGASKVNINLFFLFQYCTSIFYLNFVFFFSLNSFCSMWR